MALVVETGTGSATADSYVSLVGFKAYCDLRGYEYGSYNTVIEQALRRGTFYIDAMYRGRFPGRRRFGRAQALEWPREGAYLSYREPMLPYDAVPVEVVSATCEVAYREIASPGVLFPEPSQGGGLKRKEVGPIKTEYFEPTDLSYGRAPLPLIDALLATLLQGATAFQARVARA